MTPAHNEEIRCLEARIAELKSRWPSHSVPPRMWQELEELESDLEAVVETAPAIASPARAPAADTSPADGPRAKAPATDSLLTDETRPVSPGTRQERIGDIRARQKGPRRLS